jgi:hypothetical protein
VHAVNRIHALEIMRRGLCGFDLKIPPAPCTGTPPTPRRTSSWQRVLILSRQFAATKSTLALQGEGRRRASNSCAEKLTLIDRRNTRCGMRLYCFEKMARGRQQCKNVYTCATGLKTAACRPAGPGCHSRMRRRLSGSGTGI